ncbi:hypothetical protein EVG20_g9715 [Dentipellis fragilis]|uniref:Uncharacterized protein n=1 Tax=Dentipellis fragilis TaxID=205917 RepID=A0A4Y9XZ32_9AGAM|nr:hypothetical protein EVG20_g9715 [Dentipellis fragilis]
MPTSTSTPTRTPQQYCSLASIPPSCVLTDAGRLNVRSRPGQEDLRKFAEPVPWCACNDATLKSVYPLAPVHVSVTYQHIHLHKHDHAPAPSVTSLTVATPSTSTMSTTTVPIAQPDDPGEHRPGW